MLLSILFHLTALVAVELIALTFTMFLFVYIKKQELVKWYTFIATALIGLVLFLMLVTLIGGLIMVSRPHKKHSREEGNFNRNEMKHYWMRHHNRFENRERFDRHKRFRNWNREDNNEIDNSQKGLNNKMEENRVGDNGGENHRNWNRSNNEGGEHGYHHWNRDGNEGGGHHHWNRQGYSGNGSVSDDRRIATQDSLNKRKATK
jgi:ABC-type nickel/cobalt efflux system permease component RcnA